MTARACLPAAEASMVMFAGLIFPMGGELRYSPQNSRSGRMDVKKGGLACAALSRTMANARRSPLRRFPSDFSMLASGVFAAAVFAAALTGQTLSLLIQ
jgi:hypothetical protein